MSNNHIAIISNILTLSQKLLFKLFHEIKFGQIVLIDENSKYIFTGKLGCDSHTVTITIYHPDAYKNILFEGSVGAGKSYMLGQWDTDNLEKLVEIIIINSNLFYKIETPAARFIHFFKSLLNRLLPNNIKNAKKNIIKHYDLGNEFFELFLDPTKMYSCAVYDSTNMELEEASYNKLSIICNSLDLKSTDHVLEIGTGWGGFAIYAAQKYGCHITTTTISDKQYHYVDNQIKKLGLQHKITLLNLDYRQLSGQYDKLVSIEMIEAVGYKYLDTFFNKCNQLLKKQGLFFLQSIVINDQAFKQTKNEINFINKYIFPGGFLPSVSSISLSIANNTDMQILYLKDIGEHYVTTIETWLKKFTTNIDAIKNLGFEETFIRMWKFYFCLCIATFKTYRTSDIHAMWRKN